MEDELEKIAESITKKKDEPYACGFCGKTKEEVPHTIVGPVTNICSICVELCVDCIREYDPGFCKNDTSHKEEHIVPTA